jgi:hypothetical protein
VAASALQVDVDRAATLVTVRGETAGLDAVGPESDAAGESSELEGLRVIESAGEFIEEIKDA